MTPDLSGASGNTTASDARAIEIARLVHFLKRFANAWRASVGPLEDVSRSTTVLGVNSSQVFRAPVFAIRAVIGLRHSKRALGSKEMHCRQV